MTTNTVFYHHTPIQQDDIKDIKQSVQDITNAVNQISVSVYGKSTHKINKPPRNRDIYYWYIDSCGVVCETFESFTNDDNYRHKVGNYFLTEEEAQRARWNL